MNKFVRSARLPRGAYVPDLAETLSYYAMKAQGKIIQPKVFKSQFGGYYITKNPTGKRYTQEQLKKLFEEQQGMPHENK